MDQNPAAHSSGTEQPLLHYTAVAIENLRATLINRGGTYADFRDNARVLMDGLRASGFKGREDWPDWANGATIYIDGKQSRLAMPGAIRHRDSWLDIAGFAMLAVAIIDAEEDAKNKTRVLVLNEKEFLKP